MIIKLDIIIIYLDIGYMQKNSYRYANLSQNHQYNLSHRFNLNFKNIFLERQIQD